MSETPEHNETTGGGRNVRSSDLLGSEWTRELPKREGWYLWRKHRRQDPFNWNAYFFAEGDPSNEEDAAGWWCDGTSVYPPKGGEWLNVTPNIRINGACKVCNV